MAGADEWSEHTGGRRPLPAHQKIKVRYRNGCESDTILACERRWESWPAGLGDSDWDIVAWKSA